MSLTLENPTILSLILPYLHNLEDYTSLTSVSAQTRETIHSSSNPHQLLLLSYASRKVFFRPDPLFLLTHLASALSEWAAESPSNLRRMVESFWHGDEAALELAVSIPRIAMLAGWSISKPRELWEWRSRVLYPLTDLLDKCIGEQWRGRDNFWDQEDACTIESDPPALVFRMITYGEMFGGAWRMYIDANPCVGERSERGGMFAEPLLPPHMSLATRLEYLKYLWPDFNCPIRRYTGLPPITSQRSIRPDEVVYRHPDPSSTSETRPSPNDSSLHPKSLVHPLRAIQTEVGPYVDWSTSTPPTPMRAEVEEHMTSARHMLMCSEQWINFLLSLGGEESVVLSQDIQGDTFELDCHSYGPWMFGLKGAEMMASHYASMSIAGRLDVGHAGDVGDHILSVASAAHEEYISYLRKINKRLNKDEAMDNGGTVESGHPSMVYIGRRWCYEYPNLIRELQVLLAQ